MQITVYIHIYESIFMAYFSLYCENKCADMDLHNSALYIYCE